jgi:hypothetical protein
MGRVLFAWASLHGIRSYAVTINSETAPSVTYTDESPPSSLQHEPNIHDGQTITLFDIPASDFDSKSQPKSFRLTNSQLTIDKNVTSAEAPVNLLMLHREQHASVVSPIHRNSYLPLPDFTINAAPPPQLVLLTAAGIAALFASLVLFYRRLQRPTGKRVRFGILWDVYQPICGKCGGSLDVLNDYSFQCPSCRVELGARGENGKTISPHDALVKIRLKEYW